MAVFLLISNQTEFRMLHSGNENCHHIPFNLKGIGNIYIYNIYSVYIYIYIYSNEEFKLKFRKIERISLKIVNLSCHLSFNETCLNIYICIYFSFDSLN